MRVSVGIYGLEGSVRGESADGKVAESGSEYGDGENIDVGTRRRATTGF